jgi:hypothetical protein
VSTVRFAKVLEACGKPDIHLLLIDPAKDKTLQVAIKADRVMTLYQQAGGTDHGVVGFEEGRSRQFLVFPKPLKPFIGQRVVGIKYELLEDAPAPKKESAKKETAKPPDKESGEAVPTKKRTQSSKETEQQIHSIVPKPASVKPEEKAPPPAESERDHEHQKRAPHAKVVEFQAPEPEKGPPPESQEIKEIKRRVRAAMDALEEGKQVAAFNVLKSIVEPDNQRR